MYNNTRRKCERFRLSAADGAACEYRWELSQPFAKEQVVGALYSVESPVKLPSGKQHHEPPNFKMSRLRRIPNIISYQIRTSYDITQVGLFVFPHPIYDSNFALLSSLPSSRN